MEEFSARIIAWQCMHGRHALPWQGAGAYQVWLAEVMLQQTQVATVIPYYQRFVACFPHIAMLAAATEDEVLTLWSGLGYYSRARNLHQAAQLIMQHHGGEFPRAYDVIMTLPGIGRSTAAAICALAFHERRAILDGNVKRLLARHRGIAGYPGEKKVEALLWQHAQASLPTHDIAVYTQGLMDMGALLCTRSQPQCGVCPVHEDCAASLDGRVAQLPTPRPRKTLPEKACTLLLLLHGCDILLEKRAPSGIWGGLWCPPQLDAGANVMEYCMRHLHAEVEETATLPAFTHTFTHFKLHITPQLLRIQRQAGKVEEKGYMWLDVQDALRGAIPAPVRKILRELEAYLS